MSKLDNYSKEDQLVIKEIVEAYMGWTYENIELLEKAVLDILQYNYNGDVDALCKEKHNHLKFLIESKYPILKTPAKVS